jgi:nicotinate-nucleotide pyrophosphorylase (carboxylating)
VVNPVILFPTGRRRTGRGIELLLHVVPVGCSTVSLLKRAKLMTLCFDASTYVAASELIQRSLEEDLGSVGDLTSLATIPDMLNATVRLVVRQPGIVCGLQALPLVFERLSGPVSWVTYAADGDSVRPGMILAEITGPVRSLLTGERTVLNFMTHLSGIATGAAEYVREVAGTRAVILDTRKTLPGYRRLQKYAVRCGGGVNHRMGLYDGLLIKDNHLAARGDAGCAAAVAEARRFLAARGLQIPIEIEVDTIEQLQDALRELPDIVLLDNMTPEQLRACVALRDQVAQGTLLEASGGITLQTVRAIAESGVDRISIGSLTHSVKALDLAFDWPW